MARKFSRRAGIVAAAIVAVLFSAAPARAAEIFVDTLLSVDSSIDNPSGWGYTIGTNGTLLYGSPGYRFDNKSGATLTNSGRIHMIAWSGLINDGTMYNYGTVILGLGSNGGLFEGVGTLYNSGHFYISDYAQCRFDGTMYLNGGTFEQQCTMMTPRIATVYITGGATGRMLASGSRVTNVGTADINGTMDVSGGLNIGTLNIAAGNSGTITGSATANIVNVNGTLVIGSNFTVSNNLTLYSGGTLTVNGTYGGGSLTISGNGTINIAVAAPAGTIISPGASPGTLTFGSGLDLSSGGEYYWELASLTESGAGVNYDFIDVTGGSLVLDGTSALSLHFIDSASDPDSGNTFWQTDRTWKIIDQDGTNATNFATLLNGSYTAGNFSTVLGTAGDIGDVYLVWTYAPEPATVAMLIIGGAAMILRRRKAAASSIR